MDEREFLDCYDLLARDLLGFFARRTGDPQLAMAMLDRVVHGATIVKLKGKSYRLHGPKPEEPDAT